MKKILTVFLAVFLSVTVMGGCEEVIPTVDPPICGGKVDHTNYAAPKVIESKDIESFRTYFFRYGSFDHENEGTYEFEIMKNDEGAMTLSEKRYYGISCEADPSLTEAVQALIDEYELVKMNGVYEYTSGLPYEYAPCLFSVDYASGENLYFYTDNDPYAPWSKAFLDLFKGYFADKGFTEVLPPEEECVVTRFDYRFTDGNLLYMINTLIIPEEAGDEVIEKEAVMKVVWDMEKDEKVEERIVMVPEGYYEGIRKIVDKTGLKDLDNGHIEPFDHHREGVERSFSFCIEVESGSQYVCWYEGDDVPEETEKINVMIEGYVDDVLYAPDAEAYEF